MKNFKNIFFVMATLFLFGCAEGGTVMLQGEKPKVARPESSVEILLENPARPYTIIALVNASAKTEDQLMSTRAEAETAAMQELRRQAAEAGADAIFDIQREVADVGIAASASEWGQQEKKDKTKESAREEITRSEKTTTSSAYGSVNRNYEIIFRAKAIRYR